MKREEKTRIENAKISKLLNDLFKKVKRKD